MPGLFYILAMVVLAFPYLAQLQTFLYNDCTSAVLCLLGLWAAKWAGTSWWGRRHLDQKRKARQQEAERRRKEVQQQCSNATGPTRAIVDKPVQALIHEMKTGKLSVVQVLHAFQKEALQLTDQINCVTEPLVEAEAHAKQMDKYPRPTGLMYGLPVSVKENICLAGADANVGASRYAGDLHAEDAVVVKVLKHHGAVPFVRTNVPQSLFSYSCRNPVFGITKHPRDQSRSPGGSSGGEGAIIGGGASIMGLGTDVGGSLRTPADFCGCFALKPTYGRISCKGLFSLARGNPSIHGVPGPMARDFDSLLIMSKALMSSKMYELDATLPNLPFNESLMNQGSLLKIGYYTFDGYEQCFPPNVRAVHEAKTALESMGHDLVEFDFPKIIGEGFNFVDWYARLMTPDRGERVKRALRHDKMEPGLQRLNVASNVPAWVCRLLSRLLGPVDPILSRLTWSAAGFDSVYDYLCGVSEMIRWRAAFLQAWRDRGLDAVLCPTFPCPAPSLEDVEHVTLMGSYTALYNSVDLPVGAMPVTRVSRADVQQAKDPARFTPSSFLARKLLSGLSTAEGLTVGVQCAALPFREEICLRVMRDLDQALRARKEATEKI